MPPRLVHYATEAEYRRHYQTHCCRSVVRTFDGIRVFFPQRQFEHAFFESAGRRARDKSVFSRKRAERIDWITAALQDSAADLFVGWDRNKTQEDPNRRVCLAFGNYVVVIRLKKGGHSATFITAFLADRSTVGKIRSNRRWT